VNKTGAIFVFCLTAVAMQAQIIVTAVTDGAGFGPRVAPGSLATIFGSTLAGTTANATALPLPTQLGGTTVVINKTAVPLVYVSPSQINFQVPSNLSAGTATLYVAIGSNTSATFNFTVASTAPGIFQNSGQAAAQNLNGSANTTKNPAAAGSVIVVYMTGQGALNNPVADGSAAPSSPLSSAKATSSALIGGLEATVEFLGLTPGFAGLAQANIKVPTLPTGNYPLTITVGGLLSASTTISVSGTGTAQPSVLSRVGRLNFHNSYASSIAVNGNITYICGLNQINIIDTSDVTAPAYVSSFGAADLNNYGGKCSLNTSLNPPTLVDLVGPGSSSSTTGGPTIATYNVTTAASPIKLSQLPLSSQCTQCIYPTGFSFSGTIGYTSTSWYGYDSNSNITSQNGDYIAFDFSNPYTPIFVGLLQTNFNDTSIAPESLVIPSASSIPLTAYIASTTATGTSTAGNAALVVINIASASAMQATTDVTTSDAALFFSFAYDNSGLPLLLVAGNTTGLTTPGPNFLPTGKLTLTAMDITNETSPAIVSTLVTSYPTAGTYSTQSLGGGFFVVVDDPPSTDSLGPSTLMLVDARKTQSLAVYPVYSQFGTNGIVSVTNSASTEYLLVSDINGLSIYQVTLPKT
jgi:uncharacterized protein (TIGR03437 family)